MEVQSSKRRRSLQRRKRHLTLDSTGEEETKHPAYEIYLERGEQAGRDFDRDDAAERQGSTI